MWGFVVVAALKKEQKDSGKTLHLCFNGSFWISEGFQRDNGGVRDVIWEVEGESFQHFPALKKVFVDKDPLVGQVAGGWEEESDS